MLLIRPKIEKDRNWCQFCAEHYATSAIQGTINSFSICDKCLEELKAKVEA